MKRILSCFLLILLVLVGAAATAEPEERLIPKFEEMELRVGQTQLTRYSSTTSAMKAAGVTYETSDTSIATVSEKGYVKGVSAGECVLTITSRHNPSVSATINIRVIVPLKRIVLELDNKTIPVGESTEITWSLQPENTTMTEVVFSSNKEEVATVDQDGRITAHARGEATITATSGDGKKKATLRIKVKQFPEEIVFEETEQMIPVGKKRRIARTVLPEDTDDTRLVWTSSDPSIIRVDDSGRVEARKAGEAVITATSKVDPTLSTSVTVRGVNPVESIRMTQNSYVLGMEDTVVLKPTVLPEDASIRTVSYNVSNRNVCSVDENGVVTPLRNGVTKVHIEAQDGSGKSVTVTVQCIIPAEEIYFDEQAVRIEAGNHAFVQAKTRPSVATAIGIMWKSSDPRVATVNGNTNRPRINAHQWGRCTITGTTSDGRLQASIDVFVGMLHNAVWVKDMRVEDGVVYVDVTNFSDMHMTRLTFAMVDNKDNEFTGFAEVDLPAGATLEDVPVMLEDDLTTFRRVKVAVSGWETDTGYYTNKMEQRFTYRVSPGMMEWDGNLK